MVLTAETQAATFTWDGGGPGSWKGKKDWTGTSPVNAATSDFIFTGTRNTNGPNQDFGVTLLCDTIVFDSAAGQFTLDGGQIQFAGTTAALMQNSANQQMILNALDLNAATIFGGTGAGPVTLAGVISGAGALTKSGTSVFVLTATNSLTSGITISGGQLVLARNIGLTNNTITVNTNGGLVFSNATSFLIGGLAGTSNLTLTDTAGAAVTLSNGNNNASTTFSGVFSGSGSLVKVGTGTFTLGNNNTYTGTTLISAGQLVLASNLGLTNST
ncbi:MAG: autotransporter-associated beta strand repeat-containing protein, partial [Verrucomicrobiota bacterium]